MLTIQNREQYAQYRSESGRHLMRDLWLPMLLFGGMGAITWAIRGTDGWGGIDGVLVPGLLWGLLWHFLCRRRGLDVRGVVLWLALGLALGGELGYGQYVGWIRGLFHAGDDVLYVSPWVGLGWFMICGIGWGAPGGIILGWALQNRISLRAWLMRVFLLLILLTLLFNLPLPYMGAGLVSWCGALLTEHCPGLLFPNAAAGLYAEELDRHLARTVYTNTQNFTVLLWWLAALAVAIRQRDKTTLMCGIVIGGGFGFGFAVSALWCLGYTYAPSWIDWWKMWELHAGFNLGILYALTLFWVMQRVDDEHTTDGAPASATASCADQPHISESAKTLFLAASGFTLIFVAGMEYFFWTGLLLSFFYAIALLPALFWEAQAELRGRVTLIYSTFLLVFMLLHGGASRMGVFLELYAPEAVDQYAWPAARIFLFLPAAIPLFAVAIIHIVRAYRTPLKAPFASQRLFERMVDLCAFTAFIGALSIWPAKIGVVYALCLWVALFALTRINHRPCC